MKAEVWTGIESTSMPGLNNNNLKTGYYWDLYEQDLERIKHLGISTIRHPVPWDEMQHTPGEVDFNWTDKVFDACQRNNIRPVVDFVHHTAFPGELLPKGFLNDDFPELHKEFVLSFSRRYPWIDKYTLCNEPYVTAQLCGAFGVWYPYEANDQALVRMLRNMGRAINGTTYALQNERPDIDFIHTESLECHQSIDGQPQSIERARVLNARRFLFTDLITGRIDHTHPLYEYLAANGFTEADFQWFQDNQIAVKHYGGDYYRQSEWQYQVENGEVKAAWNNTPVGLAEIMRQYKQHIQGAQMYLTETNFFGYIEHQISWLKHTAEQVEELEAEGEDIGAYTWYPVFDSVGFQKMMKNEAEKGDTPVDPVGIYSLTPDRKGRISTELTYHYKQLARGEITSADIPYYGFNEANDPQMNGYAALMKQP